MAADCTLFMLDSTLMDVNETDVDSRDAIGVDLPLPVPSPTCKHFACYLCLYLSMRVCNRYFSLTYGIVPVSVNVSTLKSFAEQFRV